MFRFCAQRTRLVEMKTKKTYRILRCNSRNRHSTPEMKEAEREQKIAGNKWTGKWRSFIGRAAIKRTYFSPHSTWAVHVAQSQRWTRMYICVRTNARAIEIRILSVISFPCFFFWMSNFVDECRQAAQTHSLTIDVRTYKQNDQDIKTQADVYLKLASLLFAPGSAIRWIF